MLRSVPLLNTLASTIWSAAREYKEQMDMLAAARERAAAEKDANLPAVRARAARHVAQAAGRGVLLAPE